MGLIKKQLATTTIDTASTILMDNKAGDDKVVAKKAQALTGRDFEAEAAGKIAHGCYTAAIQSPALQMFTGQTPQKFFENVKVVAELAIKEVIRHQQTKEMFK